MRTKEIAALGGWMAAALLLLAGTAWAAEFSADILTRFASEETRGKIYVKGDKVRREFARGAGDQVVIARPDQQVIWVLMPQQQMYLEVPFTPETADQFQALARDTARMKHLGTETVQGYETDKYETMVKGNGPEMRHFMWIAKKLKHPIKITSPDGSFVMEYQNIQEGGVPDSLFELPQGYRPLPQVPGGIPLPKGR